MAREFFLDRIIAFIKEEPHRLTMSLREYFSKKIVDDERVYRLM